MRSILWVTASRVDALRRSVPAPITIAQSLDEFLAAKRDDETVSFLDGATLAEIATHGPAKLGPTIVISEDPLPLTIPWVANNPWLNHVISSAMLEHGMAKDHIANVAATMTRTKPNLLDWLPQAAIARRVRLAEASKRVDRLDKMSTFFDTNGVGQRAVTLLCDAAEELLTNAFYDAPVAAGVVKKPISRTHDVSLPETSACDLVYGCDENLALIRVRDPFGALTRERIVNVLTRCASSDMTVQPDESMGGAGLGLWRIFSVASFVGISVIKERSTEFIVGISKHTLRPRPFAFHMFFRESTKRRFWRLLEEADSSKPTLDRSVTIMDR